MGEIVDRILEGSIVSESSLEPPDPQPNYRINLTRPGIDRDIFISNPGPVAVVVARRIRFPVSKRVNT